MTFAPATDRSPGLFFARPRPGRACCNGTVLVSRVAGLLLLSSLTLQAPVDWRALPVDSYPVDARTQIVAARDTAVARPSDADAAGHLGLVLHAWEQYELAAAAYAVA